VNALRCRNELDMLKQIPFAAQATFNSYDKQHDRVCLPDTRVDVLKRIMAWADGHDERCIFWLNGMAGTGKSTIARTVARAYYERERLGASFFFSRGGGDVSHAGKFFTSIAVQLANKSPPLKRYICKAIEAHSNIASQAFHDQWIRLILQPLSKLAADSLQPPLILVVDALDECKGENDIRKILQLLAEARSLKTVRLRIFITSRPEISIRHGFYDIPEAEHQSFVLHNISPSIIEHDISIFLKSELEAIRREHTLPSDWPGEHVIELFVQSAGGLFIYAATACRFLRDPKWLPEDRLPLILQGRTTDKSPTQQLDNIYAQVLMHSVIGDCNGRDKEMLSDRFRQIVGPIVILYDPLSPIALSRLLNVRHRIMDVTLSPLYSVLRVPDSLNSSVRLLHPSFRDFLLDKKRCGDQHFWVDEKKAHEALAKNCLRLMFNCLRRDICGLHAPGTFADAVESSRIEQYLPPDLRYACRYWVQHFQRSEARLVDDCQIHGFLQKHFLHWLEALSLIGKTSEGVLMVKVLQSMISVSILTKCTV
jgi:NACHT domain